MHAAYTSVLSHQATHAAPTLSAFPHPLAPCTLPPSLPYSLKRRELVKDAPRQHADRVAGQVEVPGHETTTQSALTHCTSTCPHPLGIHTSPGPKHPPTLAPSLTEAT